MTRTELESAIEEVHRLRSRLIELDQGLRSLPRYGELLIRSANRKQLAIDKAIEHYAIDVSQVRSGVHYRGPADMHGRAGAIHVDRRGNVRVDIGNEAFGSAARLGSTLAHEVEVHVNRHLVHGLGYPPPDERLELIYEIEAYDYELSARGRFGLAADDIERVTRARESCHRALRHCPCSRALAGR